MVWSPCLFSHLLVSFLVLFSDSAFIWPMGILHWRNETVCFAKTVGERETEATFSPEVIYELHLDQDKESVDKRLMFRESYQSFKRRQFKLSNRVCHEYSLYIKVDAEWLILLHTRDALRCVSRRMWTINFDPFASMSTILSRSSQMTILFHQCSIRKVPNLIIK